MRDKRYMTIYMPGEMRVLIESEAQRRLCSLNDIVREALLEYIERHGSIAVKQPGQLAENTHTELTP